MSRRRSQGNAAGKRDLSPTKGSVWRVAVPVCLCDIGLILLCGLLTGCLGLTSVCTSFCSGD